MLFIAWDDRHICCVPEWVLQVRRETEATYFVLGPKQGLNLIRALTIPGDSHVDLDYEAFRDTNEANRWEMGITRIRFNQQGRPSEILWKGEVESIFSSRHIDGFSYDPTFVEGELSAIAEEDPSKRTTTAQRLVRTRLRQTEFRNNLRVRWNDRCALTGSAISSVLEAAHLKPWSTPGITDQERVAPANGLLLAAHVHTLFDSGLISFDDEGNLIWASSVSEHERSIMSLPRQLREGLSDEERSNLAYHRAKFFAE